MGKIDSEIKSKFVNDQHRFVTNLVFTANWVNNYFVDHIKPFGISPQQFNILRILKASGDWIPMSDVKDGLLDKAPNATRLADKLLSKKLIDRNRSDLDRRKVYVRITKKGLELMEEINKKESLIQEALDTRITAKDAKYVSEVLDKFRG
ncbi:MAG: MarR family transcriptional regulator [Crocinitomicaceae bacterium]|nr:MarR family transcriptional regulator [Crocinitomicaceae bacterium]